MHGYVCSYVTKPDSNLPCFKFARNEEPSSSLRPLGVKTGNPPLESEVKSLDGSSTRGTGDLQSKPCALVMGPGANLESFYAQSIRYELEDIL